MILDRRSLNRRPLNGLVSDTEFMTTTAFVPPLPRPTWCHSLFYLKHDDRALYVQVPNHVRYVCRRVVKFRRDIRETQLFIIEFDHVPDGVHQVRLPPPPSAITDAIAPATPPTTLATSPIADPISPSMSEILAWLWYE